MGFKDYVESKNKPVGFAEYKKSIEVNENNIENRYNNWLNDVNKYSQQSKSLFDGSGKAKSETDLAKTEINRIKREGERLRNFLNTINPDKSSEIKTQINLLEESKKQLDTISSDEYRIAQKYKGYTYKQISDLLSSDSYNVQRRRGLIDEAEAKWLKNQMYALATTKDIEERIKNKKELFAGRQEKIDPLKLNQGTKLIDQKELNFSLENTKAKNEEWAKSKGYKNYAEYEREYPNLEGEIEVLETVLAQKKKQEEFDKKWAGIKVEDGYNPVLNKEESDDFYQEVNGEDIGFGGMLLTSKNPNRAKKLDAIGYMTKEEKKKYNFIYEKYGIEKANEYLDDLNSLSLDEKMNANIMQNMYDFSSQNALTGVLGSLASVPLSLGSGIEYVGNVLSGQTNKRSTLASASQGFREGTKSQIDSEFWDFVYDTAMSGADSLAAAGLSAVVPFAGEILLGGSAAASTFNNALDRGVSGGDAILSSIAAGTAESLFEHLSIGKLFDIKDLTGGFTKAGIKQAAKKIGTDILVNASEETLTEIANIVTDQLINTDLSSYAIAVKDYYMQGMPIEVARSKAASDLGSQVLTAMASGALMGFGFGAGGSIVGLSSSQIKNSKRGNAIISNQSLDSFKSLAADSGISDIVKDAEKLTEKSKPSQIGAVFNRLVQAKTNEAVKSMETALLENGATKSGSNSAKGWATQIAGSIFEGNQSKIANLQHNKVTSSVYDAFTKEGKYGGDKLLNLKNIISTPHLNQKTTASEVGTVLNENGIEAPVAADGKGAAVGPVMGDTVKGIAAAPRSGEKRTIAEAYGQSVADRLETERPNPKTAKAEAEAKGKTEEEIYFEKHFAKEKQITPEEEQILKDFAKESGLEVDFVDGAVNGKGYGVFQNGKQIVISRYAKKPMAALFKHEFTHSVENAKGYAKFQKYVLEESETFKEWVKNKGYSGWEELSNNIVRKYKENGVKYENPYAKAKADIIADFVGDVLFGEVIDAKGNPVKLDTNFLVELKKNDRNLFQRFVEWVHSVLKRLTTKGAVNKDIVKLEQKFKRLAEQSVKEREKTKTKQSKSVKTDGQYSLAEDTHAITNPIEQYSKERQMVIKDYLSSVSPKLLKIIEATKNGSVKFTRHKIGDVSSREVKDIKDLLGVDVSGYTHAINTNGIKHILKRHGENGKQDDSMSIDEDIARVGWVLQNYDDVELLYEKGELSKSSEFMDSNNNPAVQIRYIKKIDGTYYVVEAVADNSYKKLWVQSVYLEKNNEDGTQAPNADKIDPKTTAKTAPTSSSSKFIISNDWENVKQKQLDIILKNNPANSDYVTWIRSVDDIHTLQETLEMSDWAEYDEYNPDYSKQDALDAIGKGKILVYSSKPISQGIFVTPSRMEAESYSGNGKVYKKLVNIEDVAWIDPTQGQFAKVEDDIGSYSLPDDGIPEIARGKSYKELDALVKEGKITSDEAFKALGKENGTMPKGESPKVDVDVPEKVSKTKNVNQFMRNVLESGHLDADMTEREKRNIISGARTYVPISDKAALNRAEKKIKVDVNGAVQEWENAINGGRRLTKHDIALGEQLLVQAAETGNANDVTRYVAELAELGTQLGQDIQALRLLKQMTGMGQLYYVTRAVARLNKDIESRYGEKHKIVEIDPNLANILANAKSEAEIDDVVKDLIKNVASQVKSSWVDKFNSWRYLAMLGNPRTHFRNIVGNAVFMPAVGTKNKIAAIMETMFVDKENRTKTFGFLKPEYRDFATEDFKKVEEVIKGGGKMNPADQIRDQMKVYNSKAFAWLEGARQFNFNALETEDGWFLKGHYIRALGGAIQARGLDVNNIKPAQLEELRTYAIKEAQKATYRDASHFAQTLNKLAHPGKDASLLSKAAGVAVEGLLPFKKTPINILKRGIEYSPIGIATSIADAVIAAKKGRYSGTQFIDGLSSGLTGTCIMLLGAFFWSIGWISGGMDYDDEDALERLAGKQPYALKVGDYTFTIDFAAPAVLPFMVGAETAKIFSGEGNEEALGFFDAIAAMGAPMTELSMLQGLNDAIETIAYSDNKMGDFATNIFASYFSQYIPTIGGQIARTFDSTRRTNFVDKNSSVPKIIQTTFQKAIGKVPYFENKKVPYIDAWGRTEENDNILLRAFENFVSPGYISKVTDDSVNNELAKIYTDTGESGVIPKRASTSFEVSGERVNLNAEEYVQYATDKGQYSRQYLEEVMSNSMYQRLPAEGKAAVISDLYSYANAKAKSNVSDYDYTTNNYYKTAAKLEAAGISPTSYYIAREAMSVQNADRDGSETVSKSEKKKALREAGFSSRDINTILNVNKK